MSDFTLIEKVADRIYPTHLTETGTDSSFSWATVLPTVAKKDIGDKSEGHVQKSDRGNHTLTHKLRGGAVLEFNMSPHGKQHIAVVKYQNKGKTYSAIHSHEDPREAASTAYMSVKRRMVTEEVDPILIEKVAKRIEKKTGKLSDKKEKIDVNPVDTDTIKEDQLNELSPKTMGRYIQSAMNDRAWRNHEIGFVNGIAVHSEKGTNKAERDYRDHENKKALKRQNGIYKALKKVAPEAMKEESEYSNDAKGILAKLDYHHGREVYHRSAAENNHRKAEKFGLTSPNRKLYKDVAKGQETIANHHRNCIIDLHKKFKELKEDQLNELSPKVLGSYIHSASIDSRANSRMAGAHSAIARMASQDVAKPDEHYMKQSEKEDQKSSKRHKGIVLATRKLVNKATVKEGTINENAYHDAAKATDTHHLELIRFRMAHPFKERTPEQHKKYKEMEAKLDQLKDVEHVHYMKHGGKEIAKHLLGPGK